MMISKENKYVFVSVPKTGTHSMYKLLSENFQGERYSGYHSVDIPTYAREYYKFCTVRNPYTKFASAWTFIHTPKGKYYSQVKDKVGDVDIISLLKWCIKERDQFIDYYDKTFTIGAILAPYYVYKEQRMPHIIFDKIIKIEEATEQFNTLPFVDKPVVVPKVHTADKKGKRYLHWEDIDTPEVRELVNEWYSEDFDLLGYDKL